MFVDQGLILPLFPGCNKDESISGKYSPKSNEKQPKLKHLEIRQIKQFCVDFLFGKKANSGITGQTFRT
jgi:hypothetical protein